MTTRSTSPVETVRLPGWEGGLNADADPFQLEPSEVPDCINVEFGLRGAVSKRMGYTEYSVSLTDDIRRLEVWRENTVDKWLIGVTAGATTSDFRYSKSGTFSSQVSGWAQPATEEQRHVGIQSYESKVYVTSKLGNPWSFDGTTWTEITDTTLSGAAVEFPKAIDLEAAHERMFAINVSTGGTDYTSRVWYSAVGDAETWDPLDWIDVDPDDGDSLYAIKAFGESIILFKERSCYILSGTDDNTFSLYPLDRGIGTNAPLTVTARESKVIFFDPRTGVWEFDGAGFRPLSDKILVHLLDGVNPAAAYKSSAFIHDSRYYLSVPWGADDEPSRTFVFDLRTESWTQWSYGLNDATERDRVIYGARPNDAAGIYKMFDGYNDDGAAYNAYFDTMWLHPENEAVRQRLRRADFAFSALQDLNMTIKMYRNFDIQPIYTKTVNTSPGGGLWGTIVWGTDDWGLGVDQVYLRETGWPKRWRVMKLRIEQNDIDARWQINRILLHVSSLARVRGEA